MIVFVSCYEHFCLPYFWWMAKKNGKVCDPEKEAIIDSKTIGFYEKCRYIWRLCWIRAISRRIPSVGVNHPNGQFIVCRRPRRQDSCSLLYHPLPSEFPVERVFKGWMLRWLDAGGGRGGGGGAANDGGEL